MEHLSPKIKATIMVAIMSAMLFVALNQTIIGIVLPRIVADLGGMGYFNWVFTIFMLTSSITAVLVGKLSDQYGRRPFLLTGIIVFLVGSFLCGLSQSMLMLIFFRAIQGLGGGMIMSTAFTAIGDLFPPRERGRWHGLMGAVFAVASMIGPTVGGYITDTSDWHWVFWIFLPVGVVSLAMIYWMFPRKKHVESQPVDYLGSALLSLTLMCILLGFSMAGTQYAWWSVQVLALFGATGIFLAGFIYVETKAQNPVLPLRMFRNSVFTISNIIGFIIGISMFGTIMYLPFFLQGAMGLSATMSGFLMISFTLCMVIASALTGQWMNRFGTYKKLGIIGLTMLGTGMLLLSLMNASSPEWVAVVCMGVAGTGLGIAFPIYMITVQNAFEHRHLGVATASVQLFRQIGGTVGVAVLGTIMTARLQANVHELQQGAGQSVWAQLRDGLPSGWQDLQNPEVLMDPHKLGQIMTEVPANLHSELTQYVLFFREAMGEALSTVFISGALIAACAVIIGFFLQELPLRLTNEPTDHGNRNDVANTVALEHAIDDRSVHHRPQSVKQSVKDSS